MKIKNRFYQISIQFRFESGKQKKKKKKKRKINPNEEYWNKFLNKLAMFPKKE